MQKGGCCKDLRELKELVPKHLVKQFSKRISKIDFFNFEANQWTFFYWKFIWNDGKPLNQNKITNQKIIIGTKQNF